MLHRRPAFTFIANLASGHKRTFVLQLNCFPFATHEHSDAFHFQVIDANTVAHSYLNLRDYYEIVPEPVLQTTFLMYKKYVQSTSKFNVRVEKFNRIALHKRTGGIEVFDGPSETCNKFSDENMVAVSSGFCVILLVHIHNISLETNVFLKGVDMSVFPASFENKSNATVDNYSEISNFGDHFNCSVKYFLLCPVELTTPKGSFVKFTLVSMDYTGYEDFSCSFGGLAIFTTDDSNHHKEIVKFCSSENNITVTSQGSSLLVIKYSYQGLASSTERVKLEKNTCKGYLFNPQHIFLHCAKSIDYFLDQKCFNCKHFLNRCKQMFSTNQNITYWQSKDIDITAQYYLYKLPSHLIYDIRTDQCINIQMSSSFFSEDTETCTIRDIDRAHHYAIRLQPKQQQAGHFYFTAATGYISNKDFVELETFENKKQTNKQTLQRIDTMSILHPKLSKPYETLKFKFEPMVKPGPISRLSLQISFKTLDLKHTNNERMYLNSLRILSGWLNISTPQNFDIFESGSDVLHFDVAQTKLCQEKSRLLSLCATLQSWRYCFETSQSQCLNFNSSFLYSYRMNLRYLLKKQKFILSLPIIVQYFNVSYNTSDESTKCFLHINRKSQNFPLISSDALKENIVDLECSDHSSLFEKSDKVTVAQSHIQHFVYKSKQLVTWKESHELCLNNRQLLPTFKHVQDVTHVLSVIKQAVWLPPMDYIFIGIIRKVLFRKTSYCSAQANLICYENLSQQQNFALAELSHLIPPKKVVLVAFKSHL